MNSYDVFTVFTLLSLAGLWIVGRLEARETRKGIIAAHDRIDELERKLREHTHSGRPL